MRNGVGVCLVWLLGLSGCATVGEIVRTRASREWNCPESQVQVSELGGGAYRVRGCGTQMTYMCNTSDAANEHLVCVKEGQPLPPAPASCPVCPVCPSCPGKETDKDKKHAG